ncbi:FIST C-terminal domain-containing protein [Xanthobacter autotrophicus]|uniref:FIST signal transduction protein n=1 Tax=Xanthobacter TaxID=279 RepID=UPI0024AABCD5|nr:FIST N-terminal domain-containing protein [Xanthobacter autotrophicus]MDI4665416.1 FIST C-terminal domain-containing protein [Xanthobacter autotrophicus]
MNEFIYAHAGDANWQMALGSCWSQLRYRLQDGPKPTLGWCYLTDHYTQAAGNIVEALRERMPEVHWVGTVGVGVAAEAVEYFDEPGMVLMLADLPPDSFRLFSGPRPLDTGANGFEAFTALVHADGGAADLPMQLKTLSSSTTTGYLFGGLSSARNQPLLFADEVLLGGVCGVAFGPEVPILSRVTQGCQPIGPQRTITRAEGNYLVTLDQGRALDCALADLGLAEDTPDEELRHELAQTLAGLVTPGEDVSTQPGQFGTNTEVRHLLGVGRKAGVLVVAEQIAAGMQLAFCKRNAEAARADLLRIVADVRAKAEAAGGIRGALYISCSGRGGPHFGQRNAEFQMVSEGLGPVPLVGFFAGGEIARHHLYGYTGVLTVFTAGS